MRLKMSVSTPHMTSVRPRQEAGHCVSISSTSWITHAYGRILMKQKGHRTCVHPSWFHGSCFRGRSGTWGLIYNLVPVFGAQTYFRGKFRASAWISGQGAHVKTQANNSLGGNVPVSSFDFFSFVFRELVDDPFVTHDLLMNAAWIIN